MGRYAENTPKNQCGLQNGIPSSGLCSNNPPDIKTATDYVNFYGPKFDLAPPDKAGKAPDSDTRHFTPDQTSLMAQAQRDMYVYIYDAIPGATGFSPLSGYSEIVPTTPMNFATNVQGFFWAHDGGFLNTMPPKLQKQLKTTCGIDPADPA